MEKKKRSIISVIVVMIIFCVIIGAITRCIYIVKGRMDVQIQESLVSMANQNAASMEKQVEAIQILLEGVATEFQKDEVTNIRAKLDVMKHYIETYNFKRMGFIAVNGIAYTTDGYQRTLRDTTCFDKGMSGEAYVSDRIIDSLGEPEEINIFSVPVYDKDTNEIDGVLFATYSADVFSEILIQDIFHSKGFTFIMKPDTTLVAGYDVVANMGNTDLIQTLIGASAENEEVLNQIISDLQAGKAGTKQIYFDNSYYIYYMPLKVSHAGSDWNLFTVIPEEVFAEQFNVLWEDIQNMLTIIMAGLAGIFIIYFVVTHKQNQLLERLAYEDELTGGANYACFKEKLSEMKPSGGYVVSVDIGDFRIVNNVCGEKAGDQLLISVWDVLQDMTKPGELSAHINADQFVMYLNMNDENAIVDRLKMLTTELHTLVEVLNVPHVMPYFGICALKGYESLEQVYSRASQAKNRIKTRRDANYAFYDDKIFQQAIDNKNLEDGFENAIEYEEFEVWYQPKYDTMEGKIVGAEALVRWRKDGELIPPFRFIPLFESNGMIALLDEYVFRNVCRQQKQWQDEGWSLIPISVNISRASLFYSDIASRYEEILKSCNLSSEYVQLEITESATLENDDIASLMDKFHNTGFRLLLDDFGNGYSSLATLNTMNFDILKLDKSLIDYIGDYKGEVLLRHTIELAKNFGLNITAEGVETKEQVNFLQEVKCDDIQGYYFSKPLPKAEFERLMQSA